MAAIENGQEFEEQTAGKQSNSMYFLVQWAKTVVEWAVEILLWQVVY